MPGGRLTLQDRREIAAGLTEGLGYAEIARRLRRPTSTVSREVNRNGGHNHYRPDQADRAAIRRAQRRRPAAPAPVQTSPDAVADPHGRDPVAVRAFEQRFTEMVLETGFPRMMALVLISLYISDSGRLTAAELVERLQVSPASISKSVQHLERLGFTRRERGHGSRRERYIIDADVWDSVWRRQADSMAEWAAVVGDGAEVFNPATPAGARLHRMSQFLLFHYREMVGATERWRRLVELPRPTEQ